MKEAIANKSLGQHWLRDTTALEAMVEAAGVRAGDVVLEVGPGTGTLTKVLLQKGAHVTASEFDVKLAAELPQRLRDAGVSSEQFEHLKLCPGDIRKFDLRTMKPGYKVVANIPYYLTSQLIRILSESVNPPVTAVLLIQKEVAERVCATPGQMSLLSVTAQAFWKCSLGMEVPAHLFTPPPKVDSQILILHRRSPLLVAEKDQKKLFRIVKAGFSARRKTLVNSLAAGLNVDKSVAQSALITAGLDPSTRAQALSVEQWITLERTLDPLMVNT